MYNPSTYDEYLKIVGKIGAEEDLNKIKDNIDKLNEIMYPEYKEKKELSPIAALADNILENIKLSQTKVEVMHEIDDLSNELSITNDETKKKDIENKLNDKNAILQKINNDIKTSQNKYIQYQNVINETGQKLPPEKVELAMAVLTDFKANCNNIVTKNNNYVPKKEEQTKPQEDPIETIIIPEEQVNQEKPVNMEKNEKDNTDEYKKKYEDLLKEHEDLKKQFAQKNQDFDNLKDELAKLKAELEEMKNKSVKDKLKNGFNKVKRAVVNVKDFAVEHKKAVIAVTIVAGLIASQVAIYGTPFAIPARIVSGLWRGVHLMNPTSPLLNSLHGINDFLVGAIPNSHFDNISGLWTIGNKVVNNVSAFESMATWMGTTAVVGSALVGASYLAGKGAKKLKNAWLGKAQEKETGRVQGIIESLKQKAHNAKNKLPFGKNKINTDNLIGDFNGYSDEELEDVIVDCQDFIDLNDIPEGFTKEKLQELQKKAEDILQKREDIEKNYQTMTEAYSAEEIEQLKVACEEALKSQNYPEGYDKKRLENILEAAKKYQEELSKEENRGGKLK